MHHGTMCCCTVGIHEDVFFKYRYSGIALKFYIIENRTYSIAVLNMSLIIIRVIKSFQGNLYEYRLLTRWWFTKYMVTGLWCYRNGTERRDIPRIHETRTPAFDHARLSCVSFYLCRKLPNLMIRRFVVGNDRCVGKNSRRWKIGNNLS